MFKRRKPLTIAQTIRQLFWPSMGIKRAMIYLKHRLLRIADSSHNIALGLAIGFGVSFTPLLGTHFIQAGLISYIFRGNIFAAIMGTFVGNPWTFPFFWWSGYTFGSFMFSVLGIDGVGDMPDQLTADILWNLIATQPMTLFLPWMLGGYILAVITILATYPVYFFLVEAGKKARAQKIEKRKNKRPSVSEAAAKGVSE